MMMSFVRHNPNDVNDDEHTKTNACMLPWVMCEKCIGLCHKDFLKMKTIEN